MAYYDALIAKWPSVQGVDVAAKLDALNAETLQRFLEGRFTWI